MQWLVIAALLVVVVPAVIGGTPGLSVIVGNSFGQNSQGKTGCLIPTPAPYQTATLVPLEYQLEPYVPNQLWGNPNAVPTYYPDDAVVSFNCSDNTHYCQSTSFMFVFVNPNISTVSPYQPAAAPCIVTYQSQTIKAGQVTGDCYLEYMCILPAGQAGPAAAKHADTARAMSALSDRVHRLLSAEQE